jgi:hypothetical protein
MARRLLLVLAAVVATVDAGCSITSELGCFYDSADARVLPKKAYFNIKPDPSVKMTHEL